LCPKITGTIWFNGMWSQNLQRPYSSHWLGGAKMKQAWDDLKSFVTITVVVTLVSLLIITAIYQNWEIFQLIFTLFSSVTSAVITYFFTKKTNKEE
jgi:hypothetical protein